MHCEWQLNYKLYKTTDLKIYIYNRFDISLYNMHIQWWAKLLDHLTNLKILTFFASKI